MSKPIDNLLLVTATDRKNGLNQEGKRIHYKRQQKHTNNNQIECVNNNSNDRKSRNSRNIKQLNNKYLRSPRQLTYDKTYNEKKKRNTRETNKQLKSSDNENKKLQHKIEKQKITIRKVKDEMNNHIAIKNKLRQANIELKQIVNSQQYINQQQNDKMATDGFVVINDVLSPLELILLSNIAKELYPQGESFEITGKSKSVILLLI
jgi:hypothetical protein